MEDSTPDSLERKFMDNFGMTIDQFERLDFDEQEALIHKVSLLKHKMKKKEQGIHSKFNFGEIFTYYPIFSKTLKKRRKLFKK